MTGEREGIGIDGREVAASPLSRAMAGSRDLAWFVLLVATAHAVSYFLIGALAYTTLTHALYEGAGQDCGEPWGLRVTLRVTRCQIWADSGGLKRGEWPI